MCIARAPVSDSSLGYSGIVAHCAGRRGQRLHQHSAAGRSVDQAGRTAISGRRQSLAGHSVSLGRLLVNQDLSEKQSLSPGYHGLWEESAAAAPIMFEGNVSGCLLVSSTQPNYFQQSRQTLIESYADLIALAFEAGEFYDTRQIELGLVPFQDVQKLYLSGFRQRLSETMIQATKKQQPLTIFEAEQIVWQQFEAELLGLPQVEESEQEISKEHVKRSH